MAVAETDKRVRSGQRFQFQYAGLSPRFRRITRRAVEGSSLGHADPSGECYRLIDGVALHFSTRSNNALLDDELVDVPPLS